MENLFLKFNIKKSKICKITMLPLFLPIFTEQSGIRVLLQLLTITILTFFQILKVSLFNNCPKPSLLEETKLHYIISHLLKWLFERSNIKLNVLEISEKNIYKKHTAMYSKLSWKISMNWLIFI